LLYNLPVTRVPLGDAPNLLNRSYTITVDIDGAQAGAEGVLVTQRGRFAGWGRRRICAPLSAAEITLSTPTAMSQQ
jgi:hypothetical protein